MTRAVHIVALTRGLLCAGMLVVALAIVWWWLSFRDVYANAYLSLPEAGRCLLHDSAVCRLAASLCRSKHPLEIFGYSSTALWVGVAALFAGVAIRASRSA